MLQGVGLHNHNPRLDMLQGLVGLHHHILRLIMLQGLVGLYHNPRVNRLTPHRAHLAKDE
jgi:hypothetical protein